MISDKSILSTGKNFIYFVGFSHFQSEALKLQLKGCVMECLSCPVLGSSSFRVLSHSFEDCFMVVSVVAGSRCPEKYRLHERWQIRRNDPKTENKLVSEGMIKWYGFRHLLSASYHGSH